MTNHTSAQRAAEVTIGPIGPERLGECAGLARDVFGFSDLETIPAWYLHTSTLYGAVAIAARLDDAIVGFGYCAPAVSDGRPCLLLTELAVSAEHRSLGIGMRLMEATRQAAVERGYSLVRWTTNAVSSRNLHLYLTRCRARIVGFRPMMYEGIIAGHSETGVDGDEVEIEWRLAADGDDEPARAAIARDEIDALLLTRTEEAGGVRVMTGHSTAIDASSPRCFVEVPWDVAALASGEATVLAGWRAGVRSTMAALVEHGFEGVDVVLDRDEGRTFVAFERPAAD